jgi:hypothetical protein
MTIAYVIVTTLSIATLTFSVAADFFLADQVRTNMDRAGVPRSWLPTLAVLRAAGAVGLAVGFAVPFIGVAAAVGVVAFFVGAIVTHVLARWYAVGYPAAYLVLAAGSLVLNVAS